MKPAFIVESIQIPLDLEQAAASAAAGLAWEALYAAVNKTIARTQVTCCKGGPCTPA